MCLGCNNIENSFISFLMVSLLANTKQLCYTDRSRRAVGGTLDHSTATAQACHHLILLSIVCQEKTLEFQPQMYHFYF